MEPVDPANQVDPNAPADAEASNSTSKKKGRPQSEVHNYFRIEPDPRDTTGVKKDVVCTYPVSRNFGGNVWRDVECGKKYAYVSKKGNGSTSSAKDHLRKAHGFSDELQPPTLKQSKVDRGANGAVVTNQVVKINPEDPRCKDFVKDIAKWFSLDGIPAWAVTKPGFQAFMDKWLPNFTTPSAPTVSGRVLEFAGNLRGWFTQYHEKIQWLALTTDGWSSDSQQHYRTITAHFFVPGTCDLTSVVLDTALCGGRDSDIAAFLVSVLHSYNLRAGKIVAITTDNANAEVAGVRLADLFRVPCGCHLLNLSMKLVAKKAKPATSRKPAQAASPVAPQLEKLHAIVTKLHTAPKLMERFKAINTEWARRNGKNVPALPAKPNNTRWNSEFTMIATSYDAKSSIDSVLHELGPTYGLESLSRHDWTVLREVGLMLKPFKVVSVYLETASAPTVPEYLGLLFPACYDAFYANRGVDVDASVKELRDSLCKDIGKRLFESVNDVTLVGLALHPVYKGFKQPAGGVTVEWLNEYEKKNVLMFFFNDLQKRMGEAILRECTRLNIMSVVANAEEQQAALGGDGPGATLQMLVPGLRRAYVRDSRVERQIESWFHYDVKPNVSAAQFWFERGGEWPILQALAKANFVAQSSSAASERVWSAADDLSGGDRATAAPQTLNAQLILKYNAPVRALLDQISLFDAFNAVN